MFKELTEEMLDLGVDERGYGYALYALLQSGGGGGCSRLSSACCCCFCINCG